MLRQLLVVLSVGLAALGCEPPGEKLTGGLPSAVTATRDRDFELEICRTRIAEMKAAPPLPGAPAFTANRPAILGRAVGEPMFFVRAPSEPVDPLREDEKGWARVARVKRLQRFDKPALRARVLRDGYVFSADPAEALALVRDLELPDLFDEPEIFLARGEVVHRLEKKPARFGRGSEYRHADGERAGQTAKVLFGDRVATHREGLRDPLHRDLRGLRSRAGFDRIRVTHQTRDALLADLRFGKKWVPALLSAEGARLELTCLDAEASEREAIESFARQVAWRARAVAALQASADRLVAERLPFDRPREAEDHFDDGTLRPQWEWAYKRGAFSFSHEEKGYLVFDGDGQPFPPQTCVEMVLDTYERASGNWYQKQGEARKRTAGALDFSDYGVKNRAGVLAFEAWAEQTPELFTHRRIPEPERIQFRQRDAFFAYLVENADAFEPGDIVAIQGLKGDGHIHQHAILIKDTDPVTGMPHALTDQMKRPRDRTWEGIMAEAPLRSLLYHVKPTPKLLAKLDRAPAGAETNLTARVAHP